MISTAFVNLIKCFIVFNVPYEPEECVFCCCWMENSVCQIDQVDCLVLFRSAMYLTVFLLVESCPLLLLLLSRFSRVRLGATPWTAAYQAPLSMGFSMARVWEWGAIACSVSITERGGNSLTITVLVCFVTQLSPILCDPMGCSPPDSSVHGILQARILEWLPYRPAGDLSKPGWNLGLPYCRQILYHLSHCFSLQGC